MRRALLILTQTAPAVFSVRAATEGAHETLAAPPGGSLLGWAASAIYGKIKDPFTMFHSGRVRFSNALPLSANNLPCWPVPQILVAPKEEQKEAPKFNKDDDPKKSDVLNAALARVGRPENGNIQYEELRGFYIAADGQRFRPALGRRLRTATSNGRAATGQLFEYQHLEADAVATARYVATIEADEGAIDNEDWEKLLSVFGSVEQPAELSLGRAAHTAYGGGFLCVAQDEQGEGVWPAVYDMEISAKSQLLRVWALSDLALIGAYGEPMLVPDAKALGLPEQLEFNRQRSSISMRRYAPWNARLRRRDIERQVISAGSVLSFTIVKDSLNSNGPLRFKAPALAGLFREAGLGRIWVAPPILAQDKPVFGAGIPIEARSSNEPVDRGKLAVSKPEENSLILWLKSQPAKTITAEGSNR